MPIVFDTARPSARPAPQRTDIACFVGFVRRRRAPLPDPIRERLRIAGWVEGPWARPAEAVEALEQVPVTVESWDAFDSLFDWRSRPLEAGGGSVCACYLGAVVRRFFSQGGRRAIIVRVGDPWPYLETAGDRAANRVERLRASLPSFAPGIAGYRLFDPADPGSWRGIEHLYGLPEVSLLCLPDLADICAGEAVPPSTTVPLVPVPEVFVECSGPESVPDGDAALHRVTAPRCDEAGLLVWRDAVDDVREFLARQRDVLFVGAVPLMGTPTALRDPLSYLEREQVLVPTGDTPTQASSAFVQVAFPWTVTRDSGDLPEELEPPDGLLAGLIAAGAIARGTYRSVAGRLLPAVVNTTPVLSWGAGVDTPAGRLAERVCVIARQPDGWALQSDVTTSPAVEWRAGSVSRMMASLVRAARQTGDADLFEANGPALWTRMRRHFEALLTTYWLEGGLGGASPDEAFEVRCDRTTMTQNDLDNGRLVATITVLPVAAIERITIVLALSASGQLVGSIREVA